MGFTPGQRTARASPSGPDGNLWFTESAANRIGRITPSGEGCSELSEGITPGSEPLEIAAGPDGNLWFTERAGARIGRITPAGVVSEFSEGITPGKRTLRRSPPGPQDSMWFTEAVRQHRAGGRSNSRVIEPPKPPTVVTGDSNVGERQLEHVARDGQSQRLRAVERLPFRIRHLRKLRGRACRARRCQGVRAVPWR